MNRRRGIPLHLTSDTNENEFKSAVKETLDKITGSGKNGNAIAKLPETATLPEVIKAVNQILERLS